MRALFTAATGMQAQQVNLDNIANNLANVSTTGFKRGRADFQDLLYQALGPVGSTAGTETPTGIQVGYGSRLASIQKLFNQGALQQTNAPLDLAIEGNGFFQISLADGTLAYTRDGSFKMDSTGQLVTNNGDVLGTPVTIPAENLGVQVGKDGTVEVIGTDGLAVPVGTLQLYRFQNPGGLRPMGQNLFLETETSGAATAGTPSQDGFGSLAQGFLELSNVSVVEELVSMIVTQRAYEINSKAINAAEEMMRTASDLKR